MKPPKPLALRIYNVLACILAPAWSWGLRRRLQRGKETKESIQQKLGLHMSPRPTGPLVWGHAVGVGESMALAGLFSRLAPLQPELNFLITTTSRTSGDALRRNGLPPRCQHQFSPVDTQEATARFLDHWRPVLAVWCEVDLWPALIDCTDEHRIPRVLVNARLSASSMAKRRWGRWIYQALLPGFRHIFAQNSDTVDALVTLGALRLQISVTGNIKALSPPLACDTDTLCDWQQILGSRPVWLLASSHSDEEALVLQAHQMVREKHPDALLIIAPRAPSRGTEIQAQCGTGTPLRSCNDRFPTAAAVYVADTVGEMGLWYRLASVALVGGSMTQVGGHNPFEPLALGCVILHGPNVSNFSEDYQYLNDHHLAQLVLDPQQIAEAVITALSIPRTSSAQPHLHAKANEILQKLQAQLSEGQNNPVNLAGAPGTINAPQNQPQRRA